MGRTGAKRSQSTSPSIERARTTGPRRFYIYHFERQLERTAEETSLHSLWSDLLGVTLLRSGSAAGRSSETPAAVRNRQTGPDFSLTDIGPRPRALGLQGCALCSNGRTSVPVRPQALRQREHASSETYTAGGVAADLLFRRRKTGQLRGEGRGRRITRRVKATAWSPTDLETWYVYAARKPRRTCSS
jgi:hypothetical protein